MATYNAVDVGECERVNAHARARVIHERVSGARQEEQQTALGRRHQCDHVVVRFAAWQRNRRGRRVLQRNVARRAELVHMQLQTTEAPRQRMQSNSVIKKRREQRSGLCVSDLPPTPYPCGAVGAQRVAEQHRFVVAAGQREAEEGGSGRVQQRLTFVEIERMQLKHACRERDSRERERARER